ncbi:hypothetical protein COU16_01410 [Candidatus Kaiserbacteria bacterium CG10_big_fil_rev_8_21_14_0_10_47_16]|uniref:Glycosyltransferase family 1 protein n=1 Tax=Candidatus Kaiserbacteria bacterium CG10_big_fil_rev_8_21_14_0_10_47_16 TaxID=1974608 RepID=A0A2H0UE24_9BACT|nr:MAG: hypothetical protein COU16_01410 [Candidatus Kaiserbacteria bacterium CG10_big_fil_rev_8_21_14_0_10_47_16]
MKILYLITKSNYGGAQRYVHDLACDMSTTHDVVVAFGGSGILATKLHADGIKTRTIDSFQRDISIVKELTSLTELWKLYKDERPNIVHLNSSKAGVLGSFVARLAGIQNIVFTAHGWPFREPRNVAWRSMAWAGSYITALFAHHVILVSHDDYAHTYMFGVRRKISVIHTAVPHIPFLERSAARSVLFPTEETATHHQNDLWLLTNAELNHNKNLFTAIDAVCTYNASASRKIFYSIIGEGELREKISQYIIERHASDHITLLGYIDDARIYLPAFDTFLLPSKKEGLPYALLEAGAAGLSAIASKVGGIPEIIEDGKNGLLIDPNSVDSIVHALETLATSDEQRTMYGNELRKKVDRDFSLTHMLSATASVYSG